MSKLAASHESSSDSVFEEMRDFFSENLRARDPEVDDALKGELARQQNQIELIASENIVSKAVLEAQGSVLTNKYAEGYPGARYYGGCEYMDVVESLAIERAKALFGCAFVNVQPHSGSQANLGAFAALLKPGDTVMGMSLDAGGHLSHGAAPNLSGKWFRAVSYGVQKETSLLDMDEIATLAKKEKPQLIIAGGSAYSRTINFARFRQIADEVGASLLVDMAHFAGLVAAGLFPDPLPHAHIVTTTTHKTLRGPRGGMILTNDPAIGKKINSAIFPGLQGGPLMHAVAAKAVALGEALQPSFKTYAQNVIENARALGEALEGCGLHLVSGGTDSHLILVDLRPKNLNGDIAEKSLEAAHITTNKNAIPYDPQPPRVTSGLRLGSPACTTRGFGRAEMTEVGALIGELLEALAKNPEDNRAAEHSVRKKSLALCARFPIYE